MADLTLLSALARAVTLHERTSWLHHRAAGPSWNGNLATQRRQRWQAQPPFADAQFFQQRLAHLGLDDEQFTQLLGQAAPAGVIPTKVQPPWMAQLMAAYAQDAAPNPSPVLSTGFLAALAPLITAVRTRLQTELTRLLKRHAQVQLAEPAAIEAMLFAGVERALNRLVTRTLALELNVARLRGELVGATAEARFAHFCHRLQQPEVVRALVLEYPVLFRLAATKLDRWVQTSLELIERLCLDWSLICTTFAAGQPPGALVAIKQTQRNTKRGGRAVVIFAFASGFNVVYKPRSLAVEGHFQDLLRWFNQRGYQPTFHPLTLLDRHTYGWVGWLDAAPCAGPAEVYRFYQRQGAYLALLYALEATDFHLSNIIAAGEHPMLIDLEALFHPRDAEPDRPPLECALHRATYHSVLRLGLLPDPELSDEEESTRFDMSGLAGTGGQRTPYDVPTWTDRDADTMRLVYQPGTIRASRNLPTLNGQPVDVVDYRAAIDAGFTTCYRFLIEQRAALLAPDGPLAAFARDEIRVVPRSGHRYSALLEESFHPNLLRDALDRDRFLDRLWADVPDEPYLARLIPHEQADLWAGDVPLFSTQAASCAVYSSRGECIPAFFPQSGLAAAHQRLASLDEADLARQCWLIHAALATVPTAPTKTVALPPAPVTPPGDLAQQLVREARAIGERLAQSALCVKGEASWIGLTLTDERHWLVDLLDADLAHGLSGVTLFLAQLGAVTGEARWRALAQATLRTLCRYHAEAGEEPVDASTPIGLFDGLGGHLYTVAHLFALWGDPALLPTAELLMAQVDTFLQEPPDEETVDLARGLAGLLVGLLALYQAAPTPRTLTLAQCVGDHLLLRIQQGAAADRVAHSHALVDYWHSPAGALWPLVALDQASGTQQWGQPAQQWWRTSDRASPGQVLVHLRTANTGAATLTDLHTRLPALMGHFRADHSLGQGLLGWLDLLAYAADRLADPTLHELTMRHAAALVTTIRQDGPVSGTPLGVETPGLMAGLAGIGYGLLRLAAPAEVPSLLALTLPGGAR
jgi:type 2 lantibiotic biosynthesis protein LanM